MVIRDDVLISRAEREFRRAHAAREGFDIAALLKTIRDATEQVKAKTETLKRKGDNIRVADLFEMQLPMNHLSQLSEMSTSVLSASNSEISEMARNVKS